MLQLNLAQSHFNQASGVFNLMHGRQGEYLLRRPGMEQHCLLSNRQRADQVSGRLDEKVFKGIGWDDAVGRGRF
nr:hypothetical protein [Pseudomonas sp. BIGb0427]